jgi:S1-C subfamily serine protease
MTEESEAQRPMSDQADETPTLPTPSAVPGPNGPSPWQGPPAWGSAPQGWPPPPAPPVGPLSPPTAPPTPPLTPQGLGSPGPQAAESAAGLPPRPTFGSAGGPAYNQGTGPTYSQAPYGNAPGTPYSQGGAPYGSPAGGAAPAWNYGYPPASWGPPPTSTGPSKGARRVLAAVAIVVLVLASAGVGAAVSAAVHSNSTNTANAPFGNNSGNSSGTNNPFGNGSGTGTGTGNGFGSGTGTGSGLGNGNGTGTGTGSNSSGSSTGSSSTPPAAILSKVNPSIVDIYTKINTGNGEAEAAGTGMILTSSGEVLTNNHVIDGATSIRVVIVATGESHTAKLVGFDVVDDVAVLQIDNVSGLKTITTADADKVEIGDSVVAIGNAGGRGGTPASSAGSVTALDQKVTAGDASSGDSETLHGMIQMSAPIEPGDSGGALVNSDGDVIGMNTAAAQSDDFFGQSGSTTAFAIPINKALDIVHQIEAGKNSDTVHVGERGILGVQVQNASANGAAPVASGAAIAAANSGGPAANAGLSGGDVITSIDGKTVTNASDLTTMMFTYHPGDKVDVGWVDSSNNSHHADVTLVAGPPT